MYSYNLRAFRQNADTGRLEAVGDSENALTFADAQSIRDALFFKYKDATLIRCYHGGKFFKEFKRNRSY